jgi:hypothetical protein
MLRATKDVESAKRLARTREQRVHRAQRETGVVGIKRSIGGPSAAANFLMKPGRFDRRAASSTSRYRVEAGRSVGGITLRLGLGLGGAGEAGGANGRNGGAVCRVLMFKRCRVQPHASSMAAEFGQ